VKLAAVIAPGRVGTKPDLDTSLMIRDSIPFMPFIGYPV